MFSIRKRLSRLKYMPDAPDLDSSLRSLRPGSMPRIEKLFSAYEKPESRNRAPNTRSLSSKAAFSKTTKESGENVAPITPDTSPSQSSELVHRLLKENATLRDDNAYLRLRMKALKEDIDKLEEELNVVRLGAGPQDISNIKSEWESSALPLALGLSSSSSRISSDALRTECVESMTLNFHSTQIRSSKKVQNSQIEYSRKPKPKSSSSCPIAASTRPTKEPSGNMDHTRDDLLSQLKLGSVSPMPKTSTHIPVATARSVPSLFPIPSTTQYSNRNGAKGLKNPPTEQPRSLRSALSEVNINCTSEPRMAIESRHLPPPTPTQPGMRPPEDRDGIFSLYSLERICAEFSSGSLGSLESCSQSSVRLDNPLLDLPSHFIEDVDGKKLAMRSKIVSGRESPSFSGSSVRTSTPLVSRQRLSLHSLSFRPMATSSPTRIARNSKRSSSSAHLHTLKVNDA
ncbi:hypothetical protein H0H92_007919 [Tricholoma furcatifolium]|nr:hypothetical protein H0H92_007919 [Tricholoma furcatifolium]